MNNSKNYCALMLIIALLIPTNIVAKKLCKFSTSEMQDDEPIATLVTTGQGTTKEIAVQNALLSAIEQTFGSFVSANSSVVNDELVKDEIVSISSGNIQKYTEIGTREVKTNEGQMTEVTLQTVVSINKLVQFAQNHGMSAELTGESFAAKLAGQSYATNMILAQLYIKNESNAISNLLNQITEIAKKGLYDFELQLDEHKIYEKDKVVVEGCIIVKPNANHKALVDITRNTLKCLSTSISETYNHRWAYGIKGSSINWPSSEYLCDFIPSGFYRLGDCLTVGWGNNGEESYGLLLDEDLVKRFVFLFNFIKYSSAMNFYIVDNLGNKIQTEFCGMKEGTYESKIYEFNPERYEGDNGFKAKKVEGELSKFRVKYGFDGYKCIDNECAFFKLYYNKSDISKLSKIEVKPSSNFKYQ